MLKKILLVLAVAIVALLVVIATRPDSYRVQRSAKIDGPPNAVFATLADFHSFAKWSPWEKRDPAMKRTISEPASGVGASYAWEGNDDVGKGKMTITESVPPTRLVQRLEFIEPFPSVADTSFEVKPDGAASNVTWAMTGKNNFMGKAFSLFMDMDAMIGKDFEEGLANLDRVVKARPAPVAPSAAEAPAPEAAPPAAP